MKPKRTFTEKLTMAAAISTALMSIAVILMILMPVIASHGEKDIRITTMGDDFLVYHGTATEMQDTIEVVDAWLVGYEFSGTYGGMHTMNKETAAEVLQTLREVSDTLKITESTDTNIKEARQKIEAVIRIIEDAELPLNAST